MRFDRVLAAVASQVAVAVLALATSASAQQLTGAVTGVVRDASGGILPGATIELANVGTDITLAQAVAGDGRYLFHDQIGALNEALEAAARRERGGEARGGAARCHRAGASRRRAAAVTLRQTDPAASRLVTSGARRRSTPRWRWRAR